MRLVEIAHRKISECLNPGDLCIDATAGNGHDSLFLAKQVAPDGVVFAIDVQKTALEKTVERLRLYGYEKNLRTLHGSHADMTELFNSPGKENITVAMYNLGYLPGGDHSIVTKSCSTMEALLKTYGMIRTEGIISVLCYRGHKGGKEETSEIIKLCQIQRWETEMISGNDNPDSPLLILIRKIRMD